MDGDPVILNDFLPAARNWLRKTGLYEPQETRGDARAKYKTRFIQSLGDITLSSVLIEQIFIIQKYYPDTSGYKRYTVFCIVH